MNQERLLDISWESIFKIFVALVSFYILYLIRNIIVWFVFAVIITVLLEPLIEFLRRRRIPKLVSVILVYFIIFGLISFLVYLMVPIFAVEIRGFINSLPQYFEEISPPLKGLGIRAFEDIQEFTDLLSKNLERMAETIFSAIGAVFGGIFATFTIFSLSFFLSLEEKPIEKGLGLIFPKKYEATLFDIWSRCEERISGWFLTRILGCLLIGILTYIALHLFGVRYPLSLAIFAGVSDFLPMIGPVFTGVMIFVVVALTDFWKAIFILIAFILIQQIENEIFLPAIGKKFIGLSPVMILLSLIIGGILWGIWGAILAIPFFGILFEFLKEFLEERKKKSITA